MNQPDTSTLRERFDRDGLVTLPGFLNADELAVVRQNVDQFIADTLPSMPSEEVFYEDKEDPSTLKQLQRMYQYSPYFHGLMFGSRFEQLAATVLDHPVRGVNMQYFNKPPGIGQPTPPHQDGFYFMLAPCEAVTMWLALGDVDEENGCVRYVPGSHRQGMRQHAATKTLGFSQGIVDYPTADDQRREVAFPAKPGDLLVHHALTIHRADLNRSSTRNRRALGWIYYATHAQQDTAAHKAYQRRLSEQMTAKGKI